MPEGAEPDTQKHHPICQWKEPWEAASMPPMVLVSLADGSVLRGASPQEIQEASGERGYITIGEDQYGVVPAAEALKPPAPSPRPSDPRLQSPPIL